MSTTKAVNDIELKVKIPVLVGPSRAEAMSLPVAPELSPSANHDPLHCVLEFALHWDAIDQDWSCPFSVDSFWFETQAAE